MVERGFGGLKSQFKGSELAVIILLMLCPLLTLTQQEGLDPLNCCLLKLICFSCQYVCCDGFGQSYMNPARLLWAEEDFGLYGLSCLWVLWLEPIQRCLEKVTVDTFRLILYQPHLLSWFGFEKISNNRSSCGSDKVFKHSQSFGVWAGLQL